MIQNTAPPNSSGAPPDAVYETARPYGEKRLSDKIKEEIPVAKLADDLGAELRRSGKGLRGLCPVHGGRNREAFAVYPAEGRWWCFHCNEGGDVLDLFSRAKNYLDFKTALIDLAGLYGVQAPPRSEGWRRWQSEKGRRHDAIRDVRASLYRRRLFRMFASDLERIADPAEREAEARQIFADLRNLAYSCAEWKAGQ